MTIEGKYPKDSFDRFDDRLCGLVLSGLSLGDSILCECVSKRWKRLLFCDRTTLMVSINDQWVLNTRIKHKELDSIIAKFSSIQSIRIEMDSDFSLIFLNKVTDKPCKRSLRSLTIHMKSCFVLSECQFHLTMNRLKSSMSKIHIHFGYGMNVRIIKRLVAHYVPQSVTRELREFGDYTYWDDRHPSSFDTRLRHTAYLKNDNKFGVEFSFDYHVISFDVENLKAFVNRYKCLTSLRVKLNSTDCRQRMSDVFSQLSRLNALKVLKLEISSADQSTVKDFREFAVRCDRLSRLHLCVNCQNAPTVQGMYSALALLGGLRALDVTLINRPMCDQRVSLSLSSLSASKCLTQLSLRFVGVVLDEAFVDATDNHFPSLQTFKLISNLKIKPQVIESVYKLPKFKSFTYKAIDHKMDNTPNNKKLMCLSRSYVK